MTTNNPFYSPLGLDDGDKSYEYAQYKPIFPTLDWKQLEEIDVVDKGYNADPSKTTLFSLASKVKHLTPAIGTELEGVELRQLSDKAKDELALLVAERGVVFLRNQEINIHEQLEFGRYFGPLHKHATTPVPKQPGLEEVHVVYNDSSHRPDVSGFSRVELWHSDVSYELNPPGLTSLKLYTAPEVGGDTLWSSGYALYSSLSPAFQEYLSTLSALHSAVTQAQGARAAGTHVRRAEIETIHPVVRVHPVTGWKSVYVNHGFTRRIVDVPKAESDAILAFLFAQMAQNVDFQVRFHWEKNSIAIWDNRVVTHSATFDFYPAKRHALRVTPHGERPLSTKTYINKFGKQPKDREEGKVASKKANGVSLGYND